MAQRSEAGQTATERLFSALWQGKTHKTAIGQALTILADALDRDLSKGKTAIAYLAAMEDLTPAECIQGFSRALEQSEFFPTPGRLRRLSGRVETFDGGASEAMLALAVVFARMRDWGVELKPIPGKIIRDRDDEGFVLVRPVREPEAVCPPFGERTEAAILAMGHGSREAGLQAISCHPSVSQLSHQARDEAPSASWRAKNASDIEQRWIRAYAGN